MAEGSPLPVDILARLRYNHAQPALRHLLQDLVLTGTWRNE